MLLFELSSSTRRLLLYELRNEKKTEKPESEWGGEVL